MKYMTLFLSVVLLSSCSILNPNLGSTNTAVTIENSSSHIEALKRDDYDVMKTTMGKASSSTFYLLFFPIGKHKSSEEIYNNAYYKAVENLPGADALILPRTKNKKFFIPLLLINYSRRTTEVSGLGVSVKGKQNNNAD